jgi:hypothetical protein
MKDVSVVVDDEELGHRDRPFNWTRITWYVDWIPPELQPGRRLDLAMGHAVAAAVRAIGGEGGERPAKGRCSSGGM